MAARHRRSHEGFTLVEAVFAIAIAAIAGAALLLGMTSSLQTTDATVEQAIATGLAQQLMDEVVGGRYAAVGAGGRQVSLVPNAWESQGPGRSRYDDIDDYHLTTAQPPEDPWGVALGTDDGQGGQRHPEFQIPAGYLDDWREEIRVYYVRESDFTPLPAGQTSDFRAVEVRILRVNSEGGARELARLERVVAYVEPL